MKEFVEIKYINNGTWTIYLKQLYQTSNLTEQAPPGLESNEATGITAKDIIGALK